MLQNNVIYSVINKTKLKLYFVCANFFFVIHLCIDEMKNEINEQIKQTNKND